MAMSALDVGSILAEIETTLRSQPQTRSSPGVATRSHYMAAANWLKRYRPKPEATNLEQVQGYREAFYHLCQLERWQLAYRLMTLPLEATAEALHDQLGRWGYETERIQLYRALLGKLALAQEAVLLDGLGHAYHALGNYDEALKWCEVYGEAVEALDDPMRRVRQLGLLGITHHAMGNYDEAIACHQRRLALCQQLGNPLETMNALGDLGIAEHSMGRYAAAQEHHEAQLALARQDDNRSQEGQALGSLGHMYDALGQSGAAVDCYGACLTIARELGDRLGECGALGGLGNVHKNRRDWEKALVVYEQSLAIAREIGHRRGEGVALANLASIYRALGEFERAYELGMGCLAIAQETQNAGAEAQALHQLGLILQGAGAFEGALEMLVQALSKFEDIGDVNGQGAALFNLGHVCAALGEAAEVWRCWLYCLAIFVEMRLAHRAEMVLEALYRQICVVEGDEFWDGADFEGALRGVFADVLGEVDEEFGPEIRALVWRELVKLRGDGLG